ncbi:EamA family transporter [Enterobacteriales bacterium SAP-6]|uniref:EamA family transporter n=1 Tax=Acerihabitans arboris TaxID=2691583 RepID=A0A845SER1_9GAMM|nr:EamA family transporter [Acerihabitans arboris]
MYFDYLALAYISLADVTALSYTAPLFTVILAACLLGEVVRPSRWAGVVVGLLGIMIMLSPISAARNMTHRAAKASSGPTGGAGFTWISTAIPNDRHDTAADG